MQDWYDNGYNILFIIHRECDMFIDDKFFQSLCRISTKKMIGTLIKEYKYTLKEKNRIMFVIRVTASPTTSLPVFLLVQNI
jgi:hypothetical protein